MNYLEKELRSLVKKDDTIFDFLQQSTLDGMWYWDLTNPEEEWLNDVFWERLGYDPDTMPHKFQSWTGIINQEDLEIAREKIAAHIQNPEKPYDQIIRYTHADGHTVWIRCRGMIMRDEEGKPIRMLGAHTDITEAKKSSEKAIKLLEKTEHQKNRLSNFAHTVSHNLRSQAGGISSLIELLEIEEPKIADNELFKYLKTAATKLSETVIQLSNVALTNDIEEKDYEVIALREYVQQIVSTTTNIKDSTEYTLQNHIPEDFNICTIPAYLESILHNLISNAIRYRDPEKKAIIEIKAGENEDNYWFSVTDNGLGLDLDKYGDKLFSLHKTFHDHIDSKGIGLFITKNQVEAMNGNIEVQSEPGAGSTFKVQLPIRQKTGALVCKER
jgi:PAS domain S-box-containing protein